MHPSPVATGRLGQQRILLPRPRLRQASEIYVSSKTKEDQGNSDQAERSGAHVRGSEERVCCFPASPNLCYHGPVGGMERRRFESGDQTPAGAVQDALVSLS